MPPSLVIYDLLHARRDMTSTYRRGLVILTAVISGVLVMRIGRTDDSDHSDSFTVSFIVPTAQDLSLYTVVFVFWCFLLFRITRGCRQKSPAMTSHVPKLE